MKRVGIAILPKGWNTFQPLLIQLKMLYSCHGHNLVKILWNKVKLLWFLPIVIQAALRDVCGLEEGENLLWIVTGFPAMLNAIGF